MVAIVFRNGMSVLVTSQARREPISIAKNDTLSEVERELRSGRYSIFLVMLLAKTLCQ